MSQELATARSTNCHVENGLAYLKREYYKKRLGPAVFIGSLYASLKDTCREHALHHDLLTHWKGHNILTNTEWSTMKKTARRTLDRRTKKIKYFNLIISTPDTSEKINELT